MSPQKTRRGRPKGTGIDDTAILEEIDSLIARQSDLKPTTAIRALGYSDPSVIRRLRDKYKAFKVASRNTRQGNYPETGSVTYSGESRAMALDAKLDHTLSEPIQITVAGREPAATVQEKKSRRPQKKLDLPRYETTPVDNANPTPFSAAIVAWQHSVRAYQDYTTMQVAASTAFVNSPGMQAFLRQQIMASQMLLAMMPPTGFLPHTAAILAGKPRR